MSSWREIERQVEERAGSRCEYCRMHQSLQGATFHIEHVTPRSRGGDSSLENLAWACPGCNLRKSDRVEIPAPGQQQMVPLFNPRAHRWEEHFAWDGYTVRGLTTIGSATIVVLDMNHPRRERIRQAEEAFGLFPPEESW